MEMEVEGIVPKEAFGVELESTAEKQSRFAKFMENAKAKMQERAEARQVKKDEKIFAKIRAELVEKVFHRSEKHLNGVKEKIDEFKNKTQGMTEADQVDNLINIADGANADTNTSLTALGIGGVSTAGGVLVGGIESNALATLSLIGGATLPITIPFIVGAALAAAGLGVSAWVVMKTLKGKKSDTLMKQLGGMEKAQEFIEKIDKFVKEVENDKAMLIEKKKSMNKKDYEKFLETYIQSKADFLKELNVQGFVDALKTSETEQSKEEQKSVSATPSLAGAMA